jgi:DNA-binding NarL/FixJ family response regulator
MNTDTESSARIGHRAIGLEHPAAVLPPDAELVSMIWVDDARLSRECLVSAVLAAQPHFVIQAVETVEECFHHAGSEPELLVYYSHAEETVDLRTIEAIHTAHPLARLVVLSDASTLASGLVRDILSLGVAGFILTRRTGLQMVVSAISLVHSGGTFVPRDFLFMESLPLHPSGVRRAGDSGKLTQREIAVLDLIRLGQPNKLIAEGLGMSASTVKVHVRNIMQKMGVANRTQVALTADQFLGSDRQR